jgi:hypothetical protein
MIHISITECRRFAKLASGSGQSHRLEIVDKMRQAASERQRDPDASAEEILEITGMILALGEPIDPRR